MCPKFLQFFCYAKTVFKYILPDVGGSIRKGSRDNCADIARLCMKYEVPISIDSDSHICYRVGHVEGALEMLEEIGFPEELVINSSVERLDNYFKGRGLHLFDE